MSIIMCHYFHDNKKYQKVQGSIDIKEFEKIIQNNYYKTISADEYLKRLEKRELKDNEICFSFDDGLKEQYDLAYKILEKYSLKGIFNINTLPLLGEIDKLEIYRYFRNYYCKNLLEFYDIFFKETKEYIGEEKYKLICSVENFDLYLQNSKFYSYEDRKFRYFRDEILKEKYFFIMNNLIKKLNLFELKEKLWINKELLKEIHKKGHIIGLHTHTHPTNLDKISYEDQYKDFKENKNILESILETKIELVAYPCGKYNNDTFKVMKNLDIKYGLAATDKEKLENRLLLKRIDIVDFIKELSRKNENNSIYK